MASNYPEVWHHTKQFRYITMFVPTQGRRARHEHLPGKKSIGRRPSWKATKKAMLVCRPDISQRYLRAQGYDRRAEETCSRPSLSLSHTKPWDGDLGRTNVNVSTNALDYEFRDHCAQSVLRINFASLLWALALKDTLTTLDSIKLGTRSHCGEV